ncbi:hypothetical protein [Pseudomonas sp. SDO5591_S426]
MAFYSVNSVRISPDGEIKFFKGIEVNTQTRATIGVERVFSVADVLSAIAHGDSFDLLFYTSVGPVSGGLVLPDGHGSVREERGGPERNIVDLQKF